MTTQFLSLTNGDITTLKPYQPGKPIAELKREIGDKPIIKMGSNENPLGPSPKALVAIEQAKNQIHLYPTEYAHDCQNAIANYIKRPVEQITIGNGSNELISLLGTAFLNPETEMIFSQYSFSVYSIMAKLHGVKAVIVPNKPNWQHDLNAIEKAITNKTRLIILDNPINPTGVWLTKNELSAFIRRVPENVLIAIDEAYYEYALDRDDYDTMMPLLDECPNLVIFRTMSKIYGLAGLRIGYSASSVEIAHILNRIRDAFNVNNLALVSAISASKDTDHIEKSKKINREGLKQLIAGFNKLNLEIIPSASNFITFNAKQPCAPLNNRLLKSGIIVRPLTGYNMEQYFRVTVGLSKDNATFLQILEKIL